MDSPCRTPVAFLIYNRPEMTARTFERIAAARPPALLVVADGPRADKAGDAERCAQARAIAAHIDWPCDLLTDFADADLGCRQRVSTGLDWVFRTVPRAIILEDDCVPDASFFRYCDEMLERYRDDQRVMMVSGFNPAAPWKSELQSYHFSYCGSIWGWASWRRAWRFYDSTMRAWDDDQARQRVRDTFAEPALYEGRLSAYEKVHAGAIDTWDMQWSFARIIQSGLSVVPAQNLIQNIGFGTEATHTRRDTAGIGAIASGSLGFPLRHNPFVAVDREYDRAFTAALSRRAA
jgi:hypothetical protein